MAITIKPVVLKALEAEAVQYTGDNITDVAAWHPLLSVTPNKYPRSSEAYILWYRDDPVDVGDWVVKWPDGSIEVYTDAQFNHRFAWSDPWG